MLTSEFHCEKWAYFDIKTFLKFRFYAIYEVASSKLKIDQVNSTIEKRNASNMVQGPIGER